MTDIQHSNPTDSHCIRSQNNKLLLVAGFSLLLGTCAGYYINEHNLLAKPGEKAGTSVSDSQIEETVKKVIMDNPELIMSSLQNMQKKSYEEQMAKAAQGVKEHKKELLEDPDSPVAGAKDAEVTVVEFFDYHCGYCKKVSPVFQKLLENHKDVRVIFKEFPILSPDSHLASQAALAVSRLKPENYFEYHQLLMQHQGSYTEEKLAEYAGKIGISADELKKEMNADWVKTELGKTAELARKIGVQGTPAIVIGDELIPGAMEYEALEFRVKSAKELANKK